MLDTAEGAAAGAAPNVTGGAAPKVTGGAAPKVIGPVCVKGLWLGSGIFAAGSPKRGEVANGLGTLVSNLRGAPPPKVILGPLFSGGGG